MPQSRGRNYDPAEDLELVRAWIRVSTDAATGVNQTAEVFWTRVKTTMEESDTIAEAVKAGMYESRTWTSLKAHFSDISKKVSKFIRCTKKIESLRESGTTERDALVKAQELYRAETKTVFTYQACYAELRVFPKFQKLLVNPKKRKATDTSSSTVGGTPDSTVASGKEVSGEANGVKASKKRLSQEQLQARAVKAQEKLTMTMESKNEIAKSCLRIQEEKSLQEMLNELYAIKPLDSEHAHFLDGRRASLLRRLKQFDSVELTAPDAPLEPTTAPHAPLIAPTAIPATTSMRISELCGPATDTA